MKPTKMQQETQDLKVRKPESVLKEAIETHGHAAQQDMCIEEMAELTQAILHFRRKMTPEARQNVEQEIADVEIMIMQMRMMFNSNNIDRIKTEKIERLRLRLEEYNKQIAEL